MSQVLGDSPVCFPDRFRDVCKGLPSGGVGQQQGGSVDSVAQQVDLRVLDSFLTTDVQKIPSLIQHLEDFLRRGFGTLSNPTLCFRPVRPLAA
jgi:hypothetical protein